MVNAIDHSATATHGKATHKAIATVSDDRVGILDIRHELGEEEIVEIIKLIGYEECFKIKRKRTKYLLDGISMNIDYIEDLDYFIEVNKTVDNENEECVVRANIYELLSSVGIKNEDYILDAYETLMYKNKYSK